MASTYAEILAKSRELHAAGDIDGAKRLAKIAIARRDAAQDGVEKDAPKTTPPERTIGHRLYDNLIGDPNDGVQSTGEALGTWLNRAGESATLGVVGDEASAAASAPIKRLLGGDATYDSELARFRQNEDNMSTMGRLSADLSGALVPGAGAVGAIGRGGNALARIGLGAAAGAGTGAVYGFMEGEGDNRAQNALIGGGLGAALGGAVPAVGAGIRSVAQGRAARQAVKAAARGAPSTEEMRALGNALYRQVDDAGVQVTPESFRRATDDIRDYLRSNTGYDELPGPGGLTPNTARVMQIMDEASGRMAGEPTAALPFRSIDQMRRQAGSAAGNVANKSDQRAGMAVIEGLDDFIQRLGPDDLVGGDAEALKSAITKARDVWSRMSKSQLIDDAIEAGDDYLSGSASGIRNQFKNILRNKKLSRGFTDAEKMALRQVTHGSTLDQLINLAGGGLSQIGAIGGGAALGGPVGAVLGTGVAAAGRKLSEAVVRRNAERVRAALASGALRNPETMNALALSGRGAELLTNLGGASAVNALALRE